MFRKAPDTVIGRVRLDVADMGYSELCCLSAAAAAVLSRWIQAEVEQQEFLRSQPSYESEKTA